MRAVLLALLATAVLLTGCDQGETSSACQVDVDTRELRELKAAAAIEDCPEGGGDADLPDVELACLGGGTAGSLSEIEGPAIINFWASNCPPCVKEMPALAAFHEQYGDQVAVVGVDYLETYPGAALELAKRSGVTYPSFADACGDLQETDLAIPGLPVFVFVRDDGSVEQSSGGVETVAEIVELAEDKLDVDLARDSV
ncbi:TlpA disulfide reductase family protein [Nocardioides bizhenqiangii]|uniref:TlpA disulfide reductase family protein n=1 Tax=Nocardioides bizhenqiangii TaxID=3095076 RepID=A0ABZ0ZRC4_9ACTN|nr:MULTISPECIES: TlpA disulfide reductase family protein [unclassified Nocardioides]MDZ5622620.1 TlpA disulfide reductase family protein [Nocardioides sp. HM23]WQQ26889.1 TlpA disulfide reductase family protein [Nocardioides sp. HM61]